MRPRDTTTAWQGEKIGAGGALRELFMFVLPKDNPEMLTRILVALGLIGLARVGTIVTPLAYGWLVDHVAGGDNTFDITVMWWLLGAYAVARVSRQIFDEGSEYAFARVAQRAVHGAALTTFRYLHSLSLKFHLDRQTGGLNRAIDRGAKGMEFLLNFALLEVMPLMIELVLVAGVMWGLFGFGYALITMLTVAVYVTYTLMLTEWRIQFRRRMNEADETAASRAVDSLINYETVKYFNAEEQEADKYSNALSRYENAAVRSRTSLSLVNVGQGVIISIGLMLVMGLAGHDIHAGKLSIGSFVVVNTYLIQLYLPLNFLGFIYREIRQSLADMERMFSLLLETRDVVDTGDAGELDIKGGSIDFENVVFSYGPRGVLRGLDLKVEAGKRVAIVGPSGAGKSTISRLLFRFYDPEEGEIRIDGQPINAVTQHSLRSAIAVVPQDTVLFNTTIADNIAYGRPNATLAEVREAAHMASLDKFISNLPDGYDTMVGERGLKLSGGEKQRVAIARAIIKRPAIFLFDEATSALDTHTEKEIQHSLDTISTGRTTLMIAHRLSTVVNCDEIFVLDKGRIIERGNHADLLAKGGAYNAMWTRQSDTRDILAVTSD
ncbi:MAG: metal ABC transporter permease [SAR116 cluster bacterium MED-G04]|jgi:ABC-type transport system involved in Fe-S cluster assembly fused permease/ATPase subunit|nr:metal ABC transporter permease [SAR116 cluster bacterium]OUW36431.1 MAG: metal ABC transporter permease [Gammaproteobacteria bacterium TMED183]PDH63048.1 MAG: metal ABC transporter permease [SAR116 cluster bacterium MED-G04]HCD50243.1 metal ABC transporter permease [Alphaproteobacteria bacterium]HCV61920.1 metal ABC transporter permease [Alphaproteobacteria bacterium]|tara:strand:+ start:4905 stop:6728 length:1824 start_codon:yes stop_codon:yes gene_type:complete